jgi:acetolactate synthase-1/2/3 large subunit
MRGGARRPHARRTPCTLSVRLRAPTKQLGLFQQPASDVATAPGYGSDLVVDLLRAAGVEYVALNPGATYRGLHDSLVNYGGNRAPELILTTHEEIAVGLAHGYAKAKGAPMAAIVHDIVGLQHASMAIFNAFCDRAPVLVLGATGPMDATRRRPWIDWIHTALVQGTQVRDYVKLDDQPASVAALPESFLRAWRVARTEPLGPVYLCLDAGLQEQALDHTIALPDVSRFRPPAPPHADPPALDEAARRLVEARFPVIVVESLGRRPEATAPLCRLAELLAAPLIDLAGESQGRPSVPGDHPLDMSDARHEIVGEADVILALDVTSFLSGLGETDRSTREVRYLNEAARVIAISLDDYAFRSWAHTFQSLAPVDLPIAADAARVLPALVAAVEDRLKGDRHAPQRQARVQRIAARHAALRAEWQTTARAERGLSALTPAVLSAEVWEVIKDEDWILANGTAKGWARRLWDWRPERSYGGSGGAGLGYGLPAALGVTLAHRGSGKVCVNLQSDGDLLYVVSGFYTAAHHRLPLLTVMFNNRTYGNDETHQETVAKARGRPIENKVVGIRIDDPAPDFARIAQGFGVHAEGPIDTAAAVGPALRRALRVVKDEGRPALVDVITRP